MNKKMTNAWPTQWIVLLCLILGWTASSGPAPAVASPASHPLLTEGEAHYVNGDYQQALLAWQKALAQRPPLADQGLTFTLQLYTGKAYQEAGYPQKALDAYRQALILKRHITDKTQIALLYSLLGDVYLAIGNSGAAKHFLDHAQKMVSPAEAPLITAHILNNQGNLLAITHNFKAALAAYQSALDNIHRDAPAPDNTLLRPIALALVISLNINRVYAKSGPGARFKTSLAATQQMIAPLPRGYLKAEAEIHLGALIVNDLNRPRALPHPDGSATGDSKATAPPIDHTPLYPLAETLLSEARQIADQLPAVRLQSYAYGYLGRLYELQQRYAEALPLTRSARFYAQQTGLAEVLYLWEWQLGRLFNAEGQAQEALEAYRAAVNTLHPIRSNFLVGLQSHETAFDDSIKPVYLELAELLIDEAERIAGKASPPGPSQSSTDYLLEARNTMERLKSAELEEFYNDECIGAATREHLSLDQLTRGTAIIYPIPFSDRLSLLYTLTSGIYQKSIPVNAATLNQTVDHFRAQLQNRISHHYIHNSRLLYDWLMRPLEADLARAGVHTVIIVPDGKLRTIPFSALYDGKDFLIDRYAMAVTPGLTLTTRSSLRNKEGTILINALSEGVQGFSPLTNVIDEVQHIQALSQGKVLLNQAFSLHNLNTAMSSQAYSIVHVASHGEFNKEVQKTFLLTYDGKISMNQLSQLIGYGRLRKEPLELLTLSACQTAIGDDRAALGLAGIAVKAGAGSALASLWCVDDTATSELVSYFYEYLRQPQLSKAEALQKAQIKLRQNRRYRHPAYWAAFLLIGNWL